MSGSVPQHPLRVEMILPSLVRAGMEMVVARLVDRLASIGTQVGVTCLESRGELANDLMASGIPVSLVPAAGLRSNVRAPALVQHLRKIKPDVVHTHSGVWLKSARAARHAGVPRVIHTVHGLFNPEPWHGPLFMRWAARFTDHIVAVSRPVAHYVQEVAPYAAGRICVIPNGVDLRRFSQGRLMRLERAAPAQEASGRFVIGHVARLDRVKNQALLLHAFALVASELPHVELAIAGDGPLRGELQALTETLGITHQVRFYGAVIDIPQWLQAVDLFVLSSDAEGTPMSILEAMASERCVVATAVGGIPELLAHGVAGVLVPPGNTDALASALMGLIRANDKRVALAQAGRARVETSYDEDLMVSQYEALYHGRPLNTPDRSERCVA